MRVDPFVQEWVAGTNGRLYVPLVNRLERYPIPDWPLPGVTSGLMLDIGCGWGRWMVAGGRRGYVPVGVDIKLEPLRAARRVLRSHGIEGYVVLADLGYLPFRTGIFDLVFSYSTIQHVDRPRARQCVAAVHRVLRDGGSTMLEFPTRFGLGRALRGRLGREPDDADPASWCVRYYSLRELSRMFAEAFGGCELRTDCYLGIGVQRADLDILPWRGKAVVILSEALKRLARAFPPLATAADSVYVRATRAGSGGPTPEHPGLARLQRVRVKGHRDGDENLAISELLACPVSGGRLTLDARCEELVSEEAGIAYPIVDGIPVLLPSEARRT
jgi:uncharacterized protein